MGEDWDVWDTPPQVASNANQYAPIGPLPDLRQLAPPYLLLSSTPLTAREDLMPSSLDPLASTTVSAQGQQQTGGGPSASAAGGSLLHGSAAPPPDEMGGWNSPATLPPSFGETERPFSIKAASLTKLVALLTNPYRVHDRFEYLEYMKILLLTYQYFATPETLLCLLIRRYFIEPPGPLSEEAYAQWCRNVKMPTQLRVFNIIRNWLEQHFSDFDHHLLNCLENFAHNVLMPTRSRSILRTLRQYRYRAYSGRERETTLEYQFNSEPPYPEVPKNIFSRTLSISDVAPVEIARQLTLIEFNLFSQIKPREFMFHSMPGNVDRPNIEVCRARFEFLSHRWLPRQFRGLNTKQRLKLLKRLIVVAQELLKLNNFNTLVALLLAMNSFVHLVDMLQAGKKKDLLALDEIRVSEHLYLARVFRNTNNPRIPYLNYHLKKIYSAEVRLPSLTNGLTNFSKCKFVHSIISNLVRYQQTPYNLQPVTQIAKLLMDHDQDEERLA